MKNQFGAVFMLFIVFCFAAYTTYKTVDEPKAADNEVLFIIDINTEDEVYLLSFDYFIDGIIASGGNVNSADGKALTGKIYCAVTSNDIPPNADIGKLSVQIYVSDTANEAGNVNDAAEHKGEYKVGNEIAVSAEYGDIYHISISGDKVGGYAATLEK